MALKCANKNSLGWRRLVTLVGSEEGADRIFQKNLNSEDSVQEALDKYDPEVNSNQSKADTLRKNANGIRFDNAFNEDGDRRHDYTNTKGEILTSNSAALDRFPELKFNSNDVGKNYSERGTSFHETLEMYVQEVKTSSTPQQGEANVKAFMQEKGIPDTFFSQVQAFVSTLKGGIVLSETILADNNVKVAGTVDLIHLSDDGKIDVYDFKTSHLTQAIQKHIDKHGGAIWNPQKHYDGYKGRRYSAQLEVYSRMIENVLGQAIDRKFVVPIEITYNDLGNPDSGIKSATMLEAENVSNYGNNIEAKEVANTIFKQRPEAMIYSLNDVSDIGEFTNKISGQLISKRGLTAEQYATDFLRVKSNLSRDGSSYRFDDKWVKFISKTEGGKKAEIVEKFNRIDGARKNIISAIKSYFRTGEDILDSSIRGAATIKASVEPYNELYGIGTVSYTHLTLPTKRIV